MRYFGHFPVLEILPEATSLCETKFFSCKSSIGQEAEGESFGSRGERKRRKRSRSSAGLSQIANPTNVPGFFFQRGILCTGYFDRGSEELPRYSPSAPPAETPELPSPPSSPPSYESEQDVARLDPDSLAAAINLAQKKEIRVN